MKNSIKEFEFENIPYENYENNFYLWIDYRKNDFTPILKLSNTDDVHENIKFYNKQEIQDLIIKLQSALILFKK